MKDFELLDKLTTAYKENNKDEFTRLCCCCGAPYESTSVEGNFQSLWVVNSTITETDDTFIGHLNQYATGEDKALAEKIERFEEYYSYEDVPEAEKDEYEKYVENKYEWFCGLYWKYEGELDSALIWDNTEKIIDDLSQELTEVEQYQFALKKLEDAETDKDFLLACDADNNSYGYYPLNYEWCDGGIWIDGIDYAIYIQHEELSQIDEETANDEDASAQLAAYYLSCNVNEIIEQVKIKIEQLKDEQELENDEHNEEEFDVNARHDDWDFLKRYKNNEHEA